MASFILLANVGEIDESVAINKLISLIGETLPIIGEITQIYDYSGRENLLEIDSNLISKAPTNAKRDITINGDGYSLKSSRAAPPAIVNHTTREKWIRICNKLGITIDMLDEMISEYWALRMGGEIGEDIAVSNRVCPFGNTSDRKDYLKILIDYFLFDGTGSKESKYPAKYILEFGEPEEVLTWNILDKDTAFNNLWPNMVFSLRSKKGMPSDYPNMCDENKKRQIEPWVRYIDDDYRGALHIRTRSRR